MSPRPLFVSFSAKRYTHSEYVESYQGSCVLEDYPPITTESEIADLGNRLWRELGLVPLSVVVMSFQRLEHPE